MSDTNLNNLNDNKYFFRRVLIEHFLKKNIESGMFSNIANADLNDIITGFMDFATLADYMYVIQNMNSDDTAKKYTATLTRAVDNFNKAINILDSYDLYIGFPGGFEFKLVGEFEGRFLKLRCYESFTGLERRLSLIYDMLKICRR